MKKFLSILIILLTGMCTLAEQESPITLSSEVLNQNKTIKNKELNKEYDGLITPDFVKNGTQEDEPPILLTPQQNPQDNVHHLQIETHNTVTPLLKDKTTITFDKGPVESLHIWGALWNNMQINMPEDGDTTSKYNVSLINVLIDGKLKGEKEYFRLMLDPTPQHTRGFFQNFVQDAFVATDRISHHKILFGHSRPVIGHEGAQSPYTLPLLSRSQISRNFGTVRKTGLRVHGEYELVDYDFGGFSSDTYFREFMPGSEFSGWMNVKPFGKTDGKYGKLVTGGGISTGERHDTGYFVSGTYIGYDYKRFWTKMEYATANGSNGGSGLSTKHRHGWYATAGYRLTNRIEAVARYDEFDPDKDIHRNNKREYTAGINYYVKGQALKLVLNYIYCQNQKQSDSHRLVTGFQLIL